MRSLSWSSDAGAVTQLLYPDDTLTPTAILKLQYIDLSLTAILTLILALTLTLTCRC